MKSFCRNCYTKFEIVSPVRINRKGYKYRWNWNKGIGMFQCSLSCPLCVNEWNIASLCLCTTLRYSRKKMEILEFLVPPCLKTKATMETFLFDPVAIKGWSCSELVNYWDEIINYFKKCFFVRIFNHNVVFFSRISTHKWCGYSWSILGIFVFLLEHCTQRKKNIQVP